MHDGSVKVNHIQAVRHFVYVCFYVRMYIHESVHALHAYVRTYVHTYLYYSEPGHACAIKAQL